MTLTVQPIFEAHPVNPMLKITRRQREIALLVATGIPNKTIGYRLSISEKTVRNILTTIYAKTGTQSRVELAVAVVRGEIG